MPQGRELESAALIRDLVARQPDYLFASATLARLHLQDGDAKAAETLLKPLLTRDRFHILEFSVLMDTYMEVYLAQNPLDRRNSSNQSLGC